MPLGLVKEKPVAAPDSEAVPDGVVEPPPAIVTTSSLAVSKTLILLLPVSENTSC